MVLAFFDTIDLIFKKKPSLTKFSVFFNLKASKTVSLDLILDSFVKQTLNELIS